METSRASKPEASSLSTTGQREEKRTTGSGTGSSDNDSLASEVGRLSEENAHLSRKLSEILGKAPATPTTSRSGSGLLSGNTGERLRDQVKKLERENRRLGEQNTALERRISSGKVSVNADEVWRLKEENRSLRSDNVQLSSEIEQLNKVASYVGNKVAKVLVGARRANNYNSQLVGELKRWNRRLEEENHRLYNIIDRMKKNGSVGDVASEALSSIHDRRMDGNAKLVKQLEDQNVKLQEEISKLSDHAISLQNLSSSSGSSGSSGILPAPRTPSNHEQEGPRRALTPDAEARRVAEKLRDVKAERRKSRNLSVESLASEAGDDMECLRRENKKYAEELERIGADLAFVRSQVTLSKELRDSNEQQTLEIQKLTEAASRVAALEEQNANQAVEVDRLLEAHTKLEQEAKAVLALREDNSQMEEDIFKLADEVERLQPFADKAAELEGRVAAYQQELAELRAEHNSTHSSEIARLKGDNVEVQRTLEALAAEKAVLQAQVRELLEERAQLQGHNKEMDQRLRQMQDKINESAGLKQELSSMSQLRGQSATYRAQMSALRNENEQLSHKVSDLAQQIAALQGRETSGMVRGQMPVDQTAQLEELQADNSSLAAETQQLRAECSELSAQIVDLQKEKGAALDPEKKEELERLREENKELSAKSSTSVLMTVELTTLRNQVSDYKKMEEQFEGLQATLKQLRSEKAALQKDAASIPALKADIQALQAQVTRAEHAQKAATAALAAASTTSLARQDTLFKQHQEHTTELESLQKLNSSMAEELAERARQLAALQAEHSALTALHEEQGLLSKQSSQKSEAIESEVMALRLTLDQERVKAARISKEAAELHAVLQTAKAERASLEVAIAELRGENAELVTRISDLLARNEEQEKLLASVLANSLSNGRAEPHALRSTEGAATRLVAATENPAYVPGRNPERMVSPRPVSPAPVSPRQTISPQSTRGDSSEQSWRALEDDSPASSQPKAAAGKRGEPLKAAKAGEAKQPPLKNGKSGFGKFFSFSGKRSAAAAAAAASPLAVEKATAAHPPATESDRAMERIAEEQVMTMYERFVDKDDIDGFMAALGFAGFRGPTAADDMEGAFASAKYACRPERLEGASEWDQLVAQATLELLEAWHGAWLATEEE